MFLFSFLDFSFKEANVCPSLTSVCFPTVFILCGTPDDIVDLKNGSLDFDAHVAIILIDLYKFVIHYSMPFYFLVKFV